MNWSAIGDLGEVLGAVGVIVTLMYLARQIHVSNRETVRAGAQEIMDQTFMFQSNLSTDQESVRIWTAGLRNRGSLDATDQARFDMRAYQLTLLLWRGFHAERSGAIDPWLAEHARNSRRMMAAAPGFAASFRKRRLLFDPEFRDHMDEEIARDNGDFRLYAGIDRQRELEGI